MPVALEAWSLHLVLWGSIDPAPCGPLVSAASSAGPVGGKKQRRKVRDVMLGIFEAPKPE